MSVPVCKVSLEGKTEDDGCKTRSGIPILTPCDPISSEQLDCHLERRDKCVFQGRVENMGDTVSAEDGKEFSLRKRKHALICSVCQLWLCEYPHHW